MSSVKRKFRVIKGKVREVTEHVDRSAVCGLPMVACGYSESKPGKSISLSVHPRKIAKINSIIKSEGIKGVEFDPKKRHNCVITSRKGRRDFMRNERVRAFFGLDKIHDDDGGYGDG